MNIAASISVMILGSSLFTATSHASEATSSHIPVPHPIERYSALWEKSPFSPASVVAEVANNSEWLMTGIMVYEQTPYVTLTNRETTKTVSLRPGESYENIKLEHAEWADNYQESFAVVNLSGSQKRITFDQKSLTALSARVTPAVSAVPAANTNTRVVPPVPTNTPTITTPTSTNTKRTPPRRRIIRRTP